MATIPPVTGTPPQLKILGGTDDGTTFQLEPGKHFVFGSGGLADVAVEGLAPVHAEFVWNESGLNVTAAGSVRVNGEASIRRRSLSDGDQVQLGTQLALLVILPQSASMSRKALALAQWDGHHEATSSPLDGLDFHPPPAAPAAIGPLYLETPEAYQEPPAPAALPATGRLTSVDPANQPGGPAGMPHGDGPRTAPRVSAPPVPLARQTPPPGRNPRTPARPAAQHRTIVASALVVGLVALAGGGFAYYRLTRPPAVSKVQPDVGLAGDEVEISGSHFGDTVEANTVRFGTTVAAISQVTQERLRVRVPALDLKARSKLSVTVETANGPSNAAAFDLKIVPSWDGIDPPVIMPGELLTLSGKGFDNGALQVTLAGRPVDVVQAQPTRVVIRIPPLEAQMTTRDPLSVGLTIEGQTLPPRQLLVGTLPYLLEVAPQRASVGDVVTLKGYGFDPAPGGTRVSIAGNPALVLAVSETSLTLCVPPITRSIVDAPIELEARSARASGGPTLRLLRSLGDSYMLRFVPILVADHSEFVDVASEFSPLLRLGARGDAPDVPRRAQALASTLNGRVAAAIAGQPVQFEVRESGDGAWLAEQNGPTLTRIEDEDAKAYGPGLSPRAVAEHWVALLNDYFTLFVKHDRPSLMLARSLRGRAMTDLQTALLRVRGANVPPDAPERVPPALAARLGQMALEIPRIGGSATSVFEGVWEGELKEEWGPPQRISLTLRQQGTGLSGSLRYESKVGGFDQPLEELRTGPEQLSFRVSLQSRRRRFVASRNGSSLTGTVSGDDGKVVEGSFTLTLQIH